MRSSNCNINWMEATVMNADKTKHDSCCVAIGDLWPEPLTDRISEFGYPSCGQSVIDQGSRLPVKPPGVVLPHSEDRSELRHLQIVGRQFVRVAGGKRGNVVRSPVRHIVHQVGRADRVRAVCLGELTLGSLHTRGHMLALVLCRGKEQHLIVRVQGSAWLAGTCRIHVVNHRTSWVAFNEHRTTLHGRGDEYVRHDR